MRFHVDSDLPVPEGSFTRVTGFDALGVVRMDLILGPPENPPIPEGGFVPSDTQEDLLAALSERAPVLVDRVDSVLVGLDATLSTTRALLDDPALDALLRPPRPARALPDLMAALYRGEAPPGLPVVAWPGG